MIKDIKIKSDAVEEMKKCGCTWCIECRHSGQKDYTENYD
jgi:hypothetical protein